LYILISYQKLDEDAEGGEAIRQASLATLGRRKRSPSTDLSDSENVSPKETPVERRRTAKRLKRQPSLYGIQSELSEMKNFVAQSMSAQAKYQEEVANQLKASNEAYLATQHIFARILQEKL
jgi:hypothetical protein